MADIVSIGIIADASGAKREIALTTEELKKLSNRGREAQEVMRRLTPPTAVQEIQKTAAVIRQVQQAQTASNVSAEKLRGAFTSLAIASGALSGPLGRIGSILGSFAMGSGVMVGVLAGIAALGFAWEKLTEKSRAAREEAERQLDVLRKLKREQDLGVLGEVGESTTGRAKRLEEIRSAMQATNRLMKSGDITGPAFATLATRRAALIEEYQELEPLVRRGEREIARIKQEEADKAADKAKQQAAERARAVVEAEQRALRDFLFGVGQQEFFSGGFLGGAGRGGDPTGGLFGRASDTLSAQNTAEFFENQGNDLRFNVIPALNEYLQKLKDAADEQERNAAAAQKAKEALVVGGIGGIISGIGGPFGGAAQGVMSGMNTAGTKWSEIFGPTSIISGASGLISGLIGMGEAASAARQRHEELTRSYEAMTDAIKEQLGIMSGLEARTRAAGRQFAEMRDQAVGLSISGAVLSDDLERIAQAIGEVNSLERAYLELLQRQEQQRIQDIANESQVLLLRIMGRNEEAEAMQRQIEYQRELTDAMNNGASAAEQFAIKEKNRLAEILVAVQKHEANIASFTATIGGLQSFRNALLLSPDAGLSPAQQLAESRRQYEEILVKALGGDQSAAGQLPGAAQTLLNFSRQMNASGPAFQSDLQTILGDNAELIQRFEDMKSVEQKMLDELIKIANNTNQLHEVLLSPVGTLPTVDQSPVVDAIGDQVEVMQNGFVELRNEMRGMRSDLDAVRLAIRDSGDQTVTSNLS